MSNLYAFVTGIFLATLLTYATMEIVKVAPLRRVVAELKAHE